MGGKLNNGPAQEIMIIGESTFELLEFTKHFYTSNENGSLSPVCEAVGHRERGDQHECWRNRDTEEQNDPALFETMAIRGKSVPGGLDQIRDP